MINRGIRIPWNGGVYLDVYHHTFLRIPWNGDVYLDVILLLLLPFILPYGSMD
jgi:hypothetical protein